MSVGFNFNMWIDIFLEFTLKMCCFIREVKQFCSR